MATMTLKAQKSDGRRMGLVVAAAMALVVLDASPAAADIRPSRVVVKVAPPASPPMEPIRLIGGSLSSGRLQLAGGPVAPPMRSPQILSRVATLDVYCAVEMSGDSPAEQAFLLYVDGRLVSWDTMVVTDGGPAYEMRVLQATIRLPAMRQAHEIKVVLDGTFASERTWIMTL
jgi:hypothetical protein